MEKQRMTMYRHIWESVKALPPEDQVVMFNAICEYGFDGREPELSGQNKIMWLLIKPYFQKNLVKYENGIAPKESKERKPTFKPPTLEEVSLYVQSKHPTANKTSVQEFAEKFWSFYESNGWMVGRNKMKNWMAAIRTWSNTLQTMLYTPKALPEAKRGSLEYRQMEYLKGLESIKNDPNL